LRSKYKDKGGRYRTLSLFKETIQPMTKRQGYTPCFTLTPEDKDELPSLHRLFVEAEDPTEYKFALEVLGSWTQWQMLKECTWFKPYYETWRRELDTRLRSKGVGILKDIASSDKPSSAQAAKWLAEGGWVTDKKVAAKKGRPSKEDVDNELRRMAEAQSELNDDALRVGATKIEDKSIN
jgi:hypothetical protein